MKRLFRLVLICILALIVNSSVFAEARHEVRVGIFPMKPLNFIDAEGTAQGLYPDLLREIVREEGWSLTFVPGSWGECLQRVQNSEIDLITTIGYSEERAKTLDFSRETVADIWGRLYKRPNSVISDISHLDKQQVAVASRDINGRNFIATAHKLGISPVIMEYRTHYDIFAAIRDGEVYAGVVPQHFGFREAKAYNLVPTTIEFEPFSVFFATNKGENTEVISKIDEYLSRWKNDPGSIYYEKIDYWLAGKTGGHRIPQWVVILILSTAGGLIILSLVVLVLRREVHRRTEEIRLREARFRYLVENTRAVPWELDVNTQQFVYVGPRITDLFGYPVDYWTNMDAWVKTLHPDEQQNALNYCTIETGKGRDHDFTYRAIHADGHTVWVQDIVSVQMGKEGPEKLYGYFVDISEQKKLETTAIRSSQLASLGELSAGVAHEINNPIGGVINYAEILKGRLTAENDLELLDRIIHEGVRIADIVKTLLSFSRDDQGRHSTHDITTIVDEPLSLTRAKFRADGIEVDVSIPQDIGSIKCNAHQIEQVILNLLSNARYAVNKKHRQQGAEKKVSLQASIVEKRGKSHICLDITDNGTGIPEENLARILNPFFTTKEAGVGTGLGLSICYDIIKLHSGEIEINSKEGEYTRVQVFLPK